jgi:hypothetical protein
LAEHLCTATLRFLISAVELMMAAAQKRTLAQLNQVAPLPRRQTKGVPVLGVF